MRYLIEVATLPGTTTKHYYVKIKKHWFSRWEYLQYGERYPYPKRFLSVEQAISAIKKKCPGITLNPNPKNIKVF